MELGDASSHRRRRRALSGAARDRHLLGGLLSDLYVKAIAAYQSPLFTIGEFGLVFAVVYHAFNGIRIIIFDYKPELWRHQAQAAVAVLVLTLLVLAPVFLGMLSHVVDFYFTEAAIAGDKMLDVVVFSILEQLPSSPVSSACWRRPSCWRRLTA